MVDTAISGGLDNHRKYIGTHRVIADHISHVLIVTRVGTQLRGTRVQVADLQVLGDVETTNGHQNRDHNSDRGRSAMGEHQQETPQPVHVFLALDRNHRVLGALLAHTCVGQGHRNKNQVGKDQHGDTDTGGDCQVLDHLDLDNHQDSETHTIGQQSRYASQEETPEGITRSHIGNGSPPYILDHTIQLLGPVTHTDRKHQEWHEYREGIQLITQRCQDPQLPDYCYQRTADDHEG